MPTYQSLLISIHEQIATVTLNRPEVRNAFNAELIAELSEVFTDLGKNSEVRVIVLAANGKSFCAGADLHWMKSMASYSYEENIEDANTLATMLQIIYKTPQPVIVRVHGDAYAGGVGLVAVCDIVIANEASSFCISEAKLGLMPATISPYVIQAMGAQAARRYFITAEKFSAKQAAAMGFVHMVTSPENLDQEIDMLCQAIKQNGPQAVIACKKLVQEIAFQEINADLIQETVQGIANIRCSSEAQERMKSFLEKK
jgi:methylglutaconyl-CoA hydratase